MISELAKSRLKKLETVIDAMDAEPIVTIYYSQIGSTKVMGIAFGPPVSQELLTEIEFILNQIKKEKGWK